jgi:uncharacterized protein YqjF (DUF2071 family)
MGSPISPVALEPVARPVMTHTWERVTFLHWPYPPGHVQRLLPSPLEVDTFDGSAWVGLVSFLMRIRLGPLPAVAWASVFPETNVRTYVRGPDGRPGIWFLSLDVPRLGAVVVARATYRLPYSWARMGLSRKGSLVTYRSRRRWPSPRGAGSDVVVDVGDPVEAADLGGLDHFLTARWQLLSMRGRRVSGALVEHGPWPFRRARLLALEENLVAATGLAAPRGDALVHHSPEVDVRVGPPRRVLAPPP